MEHNKITDLNLDKEAEAILNEIFGAEKKTKDANKKNSPQVDEVLDQVMTSWGY